MIPPVQKTISIERLPFPLSSRGADLPAASQERNERVDIEPLPTHERSCFVSGHDFSRAAHSPQRWALAPVPISSTFCSSRAKPRDLQFYGPFLEMFSNRIHFSEMLAL